MDVLACKPQDFAENPLLIERFARDEALWNGVPLLNANEPSDFENESLIRFVGMVRDMRGPEYYLERYEVRDERTDAKTKRNGKYKDVLTGASEETIDFDDRTNATSERQTYVVATIPALNDWVVAETERKHKVCLASQTKTTTVVSNGNDNGKANNKRPFDVAMETEPSVTEETSRQQKLLKTTTTPGDASTTVSVAKNASDFPMVERKGAVCLVKVYDGQDDLKLNDVCEFLGFLSVDDDDASERDDSTMETDRSRSVVPRIHCVAYKKPKHCNPLWNEGEAPDAGWFENVKKELSIVLTQLLLGDELTAEYLIYCLTSEVYARRDLLALGKFSLNVFDAPPVEGFDYVREFYDFVRMLTTKSRYIAMSLSNVNGSDFVPKKDYESNRLTTGLLQLSSNTVVVVDETKLSEGELLEKGVKGVRAIDEIVKCQKVTYDFGYYPLEFECDLPVVIFSEGKSIFSADFAMRFQPAPERCQAETVREIFSGAEQLLRQRPHLLDDIRRYLTASRAIGREMALGVGELVQDDFVEMRQSEAATVDDLHGLLVLARSICASKGGKVIDGFCWKRARELERCRKARLG